MIKFTWILLSCCLLVSSSLQQPLKIQSNNEKIPSVATKDSNDSLLISVHDDVSLKKRNSPDRSAAQVERQFHSQVGGLDRQSLLREWDDIEFNSRLSSKYASARRSAIIKAIMACVPYNPTDTEGYIAAIHEIFGEERVQEYIRGLNKVMSATIAEMNPNIDSKTLGTLFAKLRKRRQIQRNQSRSKSELAKGKGASSSQQVEQDWEESTPQEPQYDYFQGFQDADINMNGLYLHDAGFPTMETVHWEHHGSPRLTPESYHQHSTLSNPEDVANMFHNNAEQHEHPFYGHH